GGTGGPGGAQGGFLPAPEMKQDGFDVLACIETVDTKIGAGAGEVAFAQVTDLDPVGEAAGRVDGEVGKNGVLRGEVFDAGLVLAGAELAFEDLVGVGGAPVGGGGQLVGGGAAATRGAGFFHGLERNE